MSLAEKSKVIIAAIVAVAASHHTEMAMLALNGKTT